MCFLTHLVVERLFWAALEQLKPNSRYLPESVDLNQFSFSALKGSKPEPNVDFISFLFNLKSSYFKEYFFCSGQQSSSSACVVSHNSWTLKHVFIQIEAFLLKKYSFEEFSKFQATCKLKADLRKTLEVFYVNIAWLLKLSLWCLFSSIWKSFSFFESSSHVEWIRNTFFSLSNIEIYLKMKQLNQNHNLFRGFLTNLKTNVVFRILGICKHSYQCQLVLN